MAAEKNNGSNIGIILLAAGKSARLGRPKQLLPFGGQTLLQHSLQEACLSNADPVVVVLGAQASSITNEIINARATRIVNEEWQEGMAASIRCGVKAVSNLNPSADGIILMVCDQPYVTASLLNSLIAAHYNTGKRIVTSGYASTFGPPTLFHKSLFPELLLLKGDVGARNLLKEYATDVEVILFPEGTLDIDTEADYEQIKSKHAQ